MGGLDWRRGCERQPTQLQKISSNSMSACDAWEGDPPGLGRAFRGRAVLSLRNWSSPPEFQPHRVNSLSTCARVCVCCAVRHGYLRRFTTRGGTLLRFYSSKSSGRKCPRERGKGTVL